MEVIGLCGPARAGKDTTASLIAEEYDGKVIRQGFADKLKLSFARIVKPECDLQWALDFCNTFKVGGAASFNDPTGVATVTGRQALQRYGTEAHRDVFGEDFWLDAVVPEGRSDCDLLVIPDLRFPNEAERVLERGGEVWRVNRPDADPVEGHASEVPIPDELVSVEIDNAGSIDDLRDVTRYHLCFLGAPA